MILVHLPYLINRLEFSAHILTQPRSWAELVALGGLVDFGLGPPFLGQKATFLVHLLYLLSRLEFSAHILIQGRSWAELAPLGDLVYFGLGGSIVEEKLRFWYICYISGTARSPVLISYY